MVQVILNNMERMLATFFLLGLPLLGVGQTLKLTDAEISNSGCSRLSFASELNNCAEGKIIAVQDIAKKSPFLFILGGDAPITYVSDAAFEQKFQVNYCEQGCIFPPEICVTAYNYAIFDFLSDKFGKEWLKYVRKDVEGLSNWKKSR